MAVPTDEFPLPETGKVRFYVVMPSAVYALEGPDAEMHAKRHALSPLYALGQEVITQIRLASKNR